MFALPPLCAALVEAEPEADADDAPAPRSLPAGRALVVGWPRGFRGSWASVLPALEVGLFFLGDNRAPAPLYPTLSL